MPAQLIALDDGLRILLDKPILLLGRDAECDIQFESRKISRRHCCIAQVSDHLVVRDLGSTNGIRINGVRVIEGSLKAGDELTIGNHRYRVSWDALGGGPARSRGKKSGDKPPVLPVPPPELDDEVLEECDEPVPLGEAGAVPPLVKSPPQGLPLPAEAKRDSALPNVQPALPIPPVLPEQLELAPASDILPPYPAPPPAPNSSGVGSGS
jgi:predicted component of type VI protein secretion system